MENGLVLRDFEPEDQNRVRRLILDGLGEHWGEIDESLNRDLDDIAATYVAGRTIVAELNGELIGTATVLPFDRSAAAIVRMSVDALFRQSGIGRALVEELVGTARAWSATRVVLETSSNWTDVVAFYVACGFTITGKRDGDFGEDTWFEMQL